jgi:hypothetical protein
MEPTSNQAPSAAYKMRLIKARNCPMPGPRVGFGITETSFPKAAAGFREK